MTDPDRAALPAPQDRPEPTLAEALHEFLLAHVRVGDDMVVGPEAWAKFHRTVLAHPKVAAPARAHQEETEQEMHDERDALSRVDGVPGVGQGDLPRKSPTGEPQR